MIAKNLFRFETLLKSYSAVFFNNSSSFGLIIALLTFLLPNLGLGGLICVFSAYIFAILVGLKEDFFRLEFYIYNPLLVGLSLGYLFKINILTISLIVIAGILTFLLTYMLSSIFNYYLRLPLLSVPFVLVSALFYLASSHFSNLFVDSLKENPFHFLPVDILPEAIKSYLIALGSVFFLPYPLAGFFILLALLLTSRILVLLSLIGYFVGVLSYYFFSGNFPQAIHNISLFNCILSAMAIGGVFLIPTIKSYLLAAISSAIAIPVIEGTRVFWETYGLPVFALPFNLITHLMLYLFFLTNYPLITKIYKGTPEKSLDYHLTVLKRFPYTGRSINLPFSGKWKVWQSFDGEWTHKGPWKYAIDFIIEDEKGKTFQNSGYYLSDYYAFGKPVLSPVEGRVIKVLKDLPDNPPGEVDKLNNWGNYVLILDKRGFYVLLAHFKQNSIKVKEGDYVLPGKFLGQCGNSGYSPQPHIHLHVQLSPEVGSATVPFEIASYQCNGKFIDIGVPIKDEEISPCFQDTALYKKFNFLLDEKYVYKIKFLKEGKVNKEFVFNFKVKMAPDGTFYFDDGKAKLYFGIKNNAFYFYHLEGDLDSPLKYFLTLASKIPLIFKKGLFWEDFIPVSNVKSLVKREVILLLSSFIPKLAEVRIKSEWVDKEIFSVQIRKSWDKALFGKVKISGDKGFEELAFGDKVIIKRLRGRENV